MNEPIDLLQVKIEKAKSLLPKETQHAINMIDWKQIILEMQTRKGYSVDQLGTLELETELVLCGLLNPADYPKELETRMNISKAKADELVMEMNEYVFKKIREELMKISVGGDGKPEGEVKAVDASIVKENEDKILQSAGIVINKEEKAVQKIEDSMESREDIMKKVENPSAEITPVVKKVAPLILTQKLSGVFQTPSVKTEYSLNNLSKQNDLPKKTTSPTTMAPLKDDPYRISPEE